MARRKTRAPRSARPQRPGRQARRITRPTQRLAQTYLDEFEAETPRAPLQRFPQPIQPAQRSPAFAGLAEQQPRQNFAQRFANLFSGIRGPGYDFFPGAQEAIAQQFRMPVLPGAEFVASNIVNPLLGALGLSGERPQQVPSPAFEGLRAPLPPAARRPFGGRDVPGIAQPIFRKYRSIVNMLDKGFRPPMIGFDTQEFLNMTDDEMTDMGYVKVPGGWARRPIVDQPLRNVYGSGTAAQPQTVTVNYGGFGGGGGGGTSRQSSYLVNWRI